VKQLVVLVACSSEKLDVASPAKQLYQGALFKKSRAICERQDLKWAILSAKHGLVLPDAILHPYDCTLSKMRKRERMCWTAATNLQLREAFNGQQLVCLCGEHYRTACAGFDVRIPLFGLCIGEQLHALSSPNFKI
jgi:hypothetical protein